MQSILGIGILIIIIMAVALLAVGIIDGNRFVTVREEFCLSGLTKECRFVLISDLHNKVYGKKNDKVIDAVRKINPDFIILAGDLVTSKASEDMTPGIELVKALGRDYRIYYGLGNHETKLRQCPDKFDDKFDRLKAGVKDKNVILLENESVDIPEYHIRVTGLDLDLKYFAHFRIRRMEDAYLEKTLPKYDKTKCNILIAHNPDYFADYAQWGADLVLSGHVHGGIMRLPFLGGVIAPSYKIFPKYDGGVFKSGKSVMLLGRGMGSHTIPFRFFNPAELYDVTLRIKYE
ncbi:MAG: metallophosphoesterase [Lachnospiraceae bacterium]|nr:metallophosphoesterase [Lachnospiraceae bacterium]